MSYARRGNRYLHVTRHADAVRTVPGVALLELGAAARDALLQRIHEARGRDSHGGEVLDGMRDRVLRPAHEMDRSATDRAPQGIATPLRIPPAGARATLSAMASDDGSVQRSAFLLRDSRLIVGFTGAGISTESGIPDYRGTGGIWTRYEPVYFQEFLEDPAKRLEYCGGPGNVAGHTRRAAERRTRVLRRPPPCRRLAGLITQNIDGLHEKSGLPRELIVNLHGSAMEVVCLSCSRRYPSEEIAASADLTRGVPRCPSCRGLVKPDTISFGQSSGPRSSRAPRSSREAATS